MNKELLETLLSQQMELNTNISGPLWPFGKTNKGKTINWGRTVYMETAELIDSYPWKHWKGIENNIDIDNVGIELIDLWHFIMSMGIEVMFNVYVQQGKERYGSDQVYPNEQNVPFIWEKSLKEETVNYFLKIFENEEMKKRIISDIQKKMEDISGIDKEIFIFEELMSNGILYAQTRDIEEKYMYFATIVMIFDYIITNVVNLDIEKVYKGKSILNQFRQDHGYKEGTYIKTWILDSKEVEDNVVMLRLLDSENLYEELEKVYKEVEGS